MITDFILNALFGALGALLSLMPTWVLPTQQFTNVIGIVTNIGEIFPLKQFVIGLGVCLGLQLLLKGWDFVVWVYHQFWGSS